jgi:RNA polymerase sigma-70 factor, ECF subfamily
MVQAIHSPPPNQRGAAAHTRLPDADLATFDKLVRRHIGFAYVTANAYTRDHESAEDIVAIALAKAFRAAPEFRGQSRFATWLYRIVVNCAKDYLVRKKTNPVVSIEDLLAIDPTTEEKMSAASLRQGASEGAAQDLRNDVRRAISQLHPSDRQLLLLFHRDQVSYERIGLILGIPIGTVRSRLHRIRGHLRTRLCRYRR